MSILDLFYKEESVDERISVLKQENEELYVKLKTHYCFDCDRWFEKVAALNMHLRWHKGNPFQKES